MPLYIEGLEAIVTIFNVNSLDFLDLRNQKWLCKTMQEHLQFIGHLTNQQRYLHRFAKPFLAF